MIVNIASINFASSQIGTAAAVSSKAVAEARALMRRQKDLSNTYTLNLDPKFLIVPTAYETAAFQLAHSTADPSGTNSGVANPFKSIMEVVCDAALDDALISRGITTNAWFLACAPFQADGIEVSYLNGNEKPVIESHEAFNTLAIDYRMYLDFSVDVLDTKAYIKNNGI